MDFTVWLKHIGDRVHLRYKEVRQGVSFVGEVTSSLAYGVTHPQRVSFHDTVSKLYFFSLGNLSITLFFSILFGVVITLLAGLQLSMFGALIHVSTVFDFMMPRHVAPIVVNLIIIFSAVRWLSRNKKSELEGSQQTYAFSYVIALMLSSVLLYIWFFLISVMMNLSLIGFFNISFQQYYHDLLVRFKSGGLIFGMVKSCIISIATAMVCLYYEDKVQQADIDAVVSMLLTGIVVIILMQVYIQLLYGFIF